MKGKRPIWVALRVRTAFHRVVTAKLRAAGLEVFAPRCRSQQSDRHKVSETPLFPNYVFCRISSRVPLTVLMTAGVVHVVGTGKDVATPVDEVEIAAIKTVVRSGLHYQLCPFVNAGPKVLIVNGRLRKVAGILGHSGRDYKIAVGVSLLRRSVLADLATGTEFVRVSGTKTDPLDSFKIGNFQIGDLAGHSVKSLLTPTAPLVMKELSWVAFDDAFPVRKLSQS